MVFNFQHFCPTGDNIFKLLDAEMTKHKIPWRNVTAFGCDNASVMTGKHKGVASSILKKNPDIFISNCCCHLMHLAAKNGKLFFNFILFFPSAVLMIDARATCIIFRHIHFFSPIQSVPVNGYVIVLI